MSAMKLRRCSTIDRIQRCDLSRLRRCGSPCPCFADDGLGLYRVTVSGVTGLCCPNPSGVGSYNSSSLGAYVNRTRVVTGFGCLTPIPGVAGFDSWVQQDGPAWTQHSALGCTGTVLATNTLRAWSVGLTSAFGVLLCSVSVDYTDQFNNYNTVGVFVGTKQCPDSLSFPLVFTQDFPTACDPNASGQIMWNGQVVIEPA